MDIKVLRRAIESDLQEKFPNPGRLQQEVIASVLGVLREAERQGRMDVADLGNWRDTSFLGMRFDGAERDAPQSVRKQVNQQSTGERRDSMEIARSNYTEARQRRNRRDFNGDSL